MRSCAILLVLVALITSTGDAAEEVPAVGEKLTLSDEEWKKRLTAEQFQVLRQQGTERPFCGGYVQTKEHGPGTYHCAGCAAPLFEAGTKFESGTGWPSFFRALPDRVAELADRSHGVVRTEVTCARCDGHLGHVFDDGPRPTGRRFCINAVSLAFTPGQAEEKPDQAEQKK
ncbi:MAG: peptide-methionine (R)-S-oxide reductase MsrB [Planctomycetes bacterium]|nr:peptide-methionine (R)-S-oxide reductase MsrB [Planctomycetota bacterium]